MKKTILRLIFLIGLGVSIHALAYNDSIPVLSPFVQSSGTVITPRVASTSLQLPSLGSGGSPCVSIKDASGTFATSTCGGGGGGVAAGAGITSTIAGTTTTIILNIGSGCSGNNFVATISPTGTISCAVPAGGSSSTNVFGINGVTVVQVGVNATASINEAFANVWTALQTLGLGATVNGTTTLASTTNALLVTNGTGIVSGYGGASCATGAISVISATGTVTCAQFVSTTTQIISGGTATGNIFTLATSSLPYFTLNCTGSTCTFTGAATSSLGLPLSIPATTTIIAGGTATGNAFTFATTTNGNNVNVNCTGSTCTFTIPAGGGGSGGVGTSTFGIYTPGNVAFFTNSSTISASSGLSYASTTGVLTISGIGADGSVNTNLNIKSASTIGTGLNIINTDTGGHNLAVLSTGSVAAPGAGCLSIYDITASSYSFSFCIANYQTVQVTGTGNAGAGINFNPTGTGGRKYTMFSTANGAGVGGGNFAIYDENSSTYRLVLTPAGNFGIGTSTPGNALSIAGSLSQTSSTNALDLLSPTGTITTFGGSTTSGAGNCLTAVTISATGTLTNSNGACSGGGGSGGVATSSPTTGFAYFVNGTTISGTSSYVSSLNGVTGTIVGFVSTATQITAGGTASGNGFTIATATMPYFGVNCTGSTCTFTGVSTSSLGLPTSLVATTTIIASGTTLTGPAFTFASTTSIAPFASGTALYWSFINNAGYITGNQTINLTGPVTGSGATTIATTITSPFVISEIDVTTLKVTSTITVVATSTFTGNVIGGANATWNSGTVTANNFVDNNATSTQCDKIDPITGVLETANCVVSLNNLTGNVIATGTTNQITVSSSSGNLVLGISANYAPSSTIYGAGYGLGVSGSNLAVSSTFASSSVSFNFYTPTTTAGYSFATVYTANQKNIVYADCGEQASATTTVELGYATTTAKAIAGTIGQIILNTANFACGVSGVSTSTFTTSTLPAASWLIAVVSSTVGTPVHTTVDIGATIQ